MTVEDQQIATDTAQPADLSEDAALEAVYDQVTAADGPTRGEDGKFQSAKGEEGEEPAAEEGEEPAPEAEEPEEAPEAETPAVPMPPNWNGMDEDWKKIPADVQAKIAARDTELHARMSEQGRQIGQFRPFVDVLERNRDLFEGRQMPDGKPVTPTYAVDFLLGAQRALDADPIRTLIDIAERYDVRPQLAAVLSGQAQLPPAQRQPPAGVQPADVRSMVQEAITQDQQVRQANEELARLSEGKPFYSEISEQDMVHAIRKARGKLGDTASNQAVFDLAYDIAVNADPDLRKKAAAPAPARAASPDPKRTADARRAASVNVTSTSTGKGRKLTEDEILADAFDAANEKAR